MFFNILFLLACGLGAFSAVLLLWTAISRHLGYDEPDWFYRAGTTSCTAALILLAVTGVETLTNAFFGGTP